MSVDQKFLEKKSLEYRKTIIEIIYNSGAGHTGGSLSCIDILNVLYNGILEITPNNFATIERNNYIHSKGHSVEALYTVLCDLSFFKKEDLDTLNAFDSHFIGHPTKKVLGVEHNTGALGHGLSVAVGLALAKKKDESKKKVFALLGDGELSEGLFGRLVHLQTNINWIISLSLLIEIIYKSLVKQKMLIQLNLWMRNLNLLVLT